MDVSNRKKNTIRVLLSEGSSLSAREALSALGLAGYCIDIDANPRLVECMNAMFSGLNLAEIMVRLSRGEQMMPQEVGCSGVQSSMLMMVQLLLNPARGKQITAGAVADYALTPNAIRVIQQEM